MNTTTYALVTPSYWMDVEQCRYLLETVERWVHERVRHYLIVADRDLKYFKPLLNSRTSLIVAEDIIPRWLFRFPGMRRFWLSLRTRPVKNWILQQIVKLSAPTAISEDVLLYADSDMFFITPFDPLHYERDGAVPLFAESGQRGLLPTHEHWQVICSNLLGVPGQTDFDLNYVGQLIWWRRRNALAAVRRVEDVAGRAWQEVIASRWTFSEYILYGLHSDRILGGQSGHWRDGLIRTLCYWETDPLDVAGLERLKAQREAHHHSVMISSKSHTPVSHIREVFGCT